MRVSAPPTATQTDDSIQSERPSRPWITILVVAACCLWPIVTYHLDAPLRFDPGIFVGPGHWVVGILKVLRIQARDHPTSLIPLVCAPIAALVFVIATRTRRRMRERPGGRWGIGGWLALFVLSSVLGVVINVRGLYISRDAIFESLLELPHLGQAASPALALLILAQNLVAVVGTLACIVGALADHTPQPSGAAILDDTPCGASGSAGIPSRDGRVGATGRGKSADRPLPERGIRARGSCQCRNQSRMVRVLVALAARGSDVRESGGGAVHRSGACDRVSGHVDAESATQLTWGARPTALLLRVLARSMRNRPVVSLPAGFEIRAAIKP